MTSHPVRWGAPTLKPKGPFVNEDLKTLTAAVDADAPTLGMSTVYRLFEAFIALREKNERQHKLFEQTLSRTRDNLQSSFNSFAADTQKAYQQLKQDFQGEKRFSLNLLNEFLDMALELDHILANRPALPSTGTEADSLGRWMEALEIQNRKLKDSLRQLGIHPYDAVVGAVYNPALHERVGSQRLEGYEGLRIAAQKERGWASQQPEFILRRPKVYVTE